MSETSGNLQQTSLHDWHVELGGKMVGFAGYLMPVQYPSGIVTEHNHTRTKAGLFDVSHMGQVLLKGKSHTHVSAELEKLVPGDIAALEVGRTRYTQFTTQQGGILDDLMVTRTQEDGTLCLVVNASRKDSDHELMKAGLDSSVEIIRIEDRSLIALQGPAAERVLGTLADGVERMAFMSPETINIDGIECWVSRSGYTGEDGFEISVHNDEAVSLAQKLLANEDYLEAAE